MKLEINPGLEIQVANIAPGQRCAVVDDFLLNPGAAFDWACAREGDFVEPERLSPNPRRGRLMLNCFLATLPRR